MLFPGTRRGLGSPIRGAAGQSETERFCYPTMLSIWHVYGEQADSPMNRLLTEFNDTVGKEKGILLNVTNMTNSARRPAAGCQGRETRRAGPAGPVLGPPLGCQCTGH